MRMRTIGQQLLGGALIAGLLAAALAAPAPQASASSHREAPLISSDPQADNTDLYFFRSPDKPDTVTIVANYIPLEEPNGGPYFNQFGDDVRYELHVDNDGDARSDVTFRFSFETEIQNPNTFLYITGPVTAPDDANFNFQQRYGVQVIRPGEAPEFLGTGMVPPANVGPRSTPNYDQIAAQAIKELPHGITAFAGPRDDPFFVDLGSIFDLGGLRPFNELHAVPLSGDKFGLAGIDGVNGYNTHAIILQVPIAFLTSDGKGADETSQPVLGVYASASRQRLRVLGEDGTVRNSGRYVQVSRLGNPLINEVIIPAGRKDYWNSQPPRKDSQFETHYLRPELAGIVNLLYGAALEDVDTTGRTDLSLILLQGVPGVNQARANPVKADLLRLNVQAAPLLPVGTGNPLTVIGEAGEVELGWPNGRRLEDDVTDIALKAVAQGYGPFLNAAFGLPNKSPNNLVGDGVDANDRAFLQSFPYLAAPFSGYESRLHGGFAVPASPE